MLDEHVLVMEQENKPLSRWMQWYNNGGRESVLARRRKQGYLNKKEWLELTIQKHV
jgi:hypothetical protein